MLDNILGSVNSFLNEEIICDSNLLPKVMKCNQGVIHYNDYYVNSFNFLMLKFFILFQEDALTLQVWKFNSIFKD